MEVLLAFQAVLDKNCSCPQGLYSVLGRLSLYRRSLPLTLIDMAATKISRVQVDDGIYLHVKLLGDEQHTSKPLLIALHGAPGLFTSAEPEACFGFLSPQFRILVFDGRGSGDSDIVGPYTHERWMKDIEFLR
jgi:pimeloyl-ACP methyl ester carboxylesterase